jgi:hypothetical protein
MGLVGAGSLWPPLELYLYREDENEVMGAPKKSLSNIRKPKKRCVAEFGGKETRTSFCVEVLWLSYTN